MKHTLIISSILILACSGVYSPFVQTKDDQRDLYRAVERGEIVPLTQLLSYLEERYTGKVIEIELEREDGLLFYEIEMLGSAGQVAEFTFNARTGDLIEMEGVNIKAMERP